MPPGVQPRLLKAAFNQVFSIFKMGGVSYIVPDACNNFKVISQLNTIYHVNYVLYVGHLPVISHQADRIIVRVANGVKIPDDLLAVARRGWETNVACDTSGAYNKVLTAIVGKQQLNINIIVFCICKVKIDNDLSGAPGVFNANV